MQLFTKVNIPKFSKSIDFETVNVFLGSCFSDNIGNWLHDIKFNSISNPFGTMYNPLSVSRCVEHIIHCTVFEEKDLCERKLQYFSYDFHGSFADKNKKSVLNKMNEAVKIAHEKLKIADYLFITFGTAWVFELMSTGNVVANCHKMPSNTFSRRKLEVEEIVNVWDKLQNLLFERFPKLNIVYTVSPIRHLKDGAIENTRSKATLFVALEKLLKNNIRVHYFPAYEIVQDELRDYRFYAKDMVHLSEIAIDYIRKEFSDAFFDISTFEIIKQIEDIVAASKHKPLHPESIEYSQFCNKMLAKIKSIELSYPNLDFSKEKAIFS
jgi:hypothetical protein